MTTAAGQGGSWPLGKSGDRPEASPPARTELPVCLPGKTQKSLAEQDAGCVFSGSSGEDFGPGLGSSCQCWSFDRFSCSPQQDSHSPLNERHEGCAWVREREREIIVKYVFINVSLTLHKINDLQITVH